MLYYLFICLFVDASRFATFTYVCTRGADDAQVWSARFRHALIEILK